MNNRSKGIIMSIWFTYLILVSSKTTLFMMFQKAELSLRMFYCSELTVVIEVIFFNWYLSCSVFISVSIIHSSLMETYNHTCAPKLNFIVLFLLWWGKGITNKNNAFRVKYIEANIVSFYIINEGGFSKSQI